MKAYAVRSITTKKFYNHKLFFKIGPAKVSAFYANENHGHKIRPAVVLKPEFEVVEFDLVESKTYSNQPTEPKFKGILHNVKPSEGSIIKRILK